MNHLKHSLTLASTVRYMSSSVKVSPLSGAIGAEVSLPSGVNLSNVNQEVMEEVKQALWDHCVIFFRDQDMTPKQHVEFAQHWGTPDIHPIVKGLDDHPEVMQVVKEAGTKTRFGETWHTDNSYMKTPSAISILRGLEIPPYGNDTLWANMYLAYETLSDGLRNTLEPMKCIHGAGRAFSVSPERKDQYDGKGAMKYDESEALDEVVEHPVVRTHPITGRKGLYVNSMFTYRFAGWTDEESAPLLKTLFDHIARPELQCRFRWQQYSVAIWDNRCTQHIAIGDDFDQTHRRVMQRVTIAGEVPE